jgi:peptide/nickel transport system substrate-binding protein
MTKRSVSVRGFLAAVLTLSLFLTACSSGGGKSTGPGPGSTDQPKVKDRFTFAIQREPDNMDPVTQDGNPNIWTFLNIYQTLIKLNPAGDGFEADLAEKWSSTPDGLTWTFNLRKDAKFSNGTPVTAKDVVFSLNRSKDVKGPWQWAMGDVGKIEAKDDFTVVITLKQPSAPFLSNISLFSNAILSADFFKDAKPEKFSNEPMGSGPYKMTEWRKGEYLVLQANPNYFKQGFPKTKEVKLLYIPDDDTRIIKLQSGEVDGIDNPPMARVAELKANAQLDMQLNPSTAVAHLTLNNKEGPTANIDFRKALAYAADREGIIKAVLFGNGTPATSYLPQTTLFFDKNLKAYNYDLNKAKELMAKSGVAAGTKLEILFRAGNQVQQQTATALKDMWGKLGLDVILNPMDPAAADVKYKANNFQVYVTGWTNDIPDPSQLTEYELGYKLSKSYHSQYQSDKMDQLIAAGVRELDPKKREPIYHEIQALAIADSPLIWLYYAPFPLTLNKKVEGFRQMSTGPWVFENVVVHP